MNNSKKVAFCGVISCISTLCMFLTSIIPIGTFALPAIASVFILFTVIETDKKWAFMTLTSTTVLSLLFAQDKEAVIIFIMFFGPYSIIKLLIENINNKYIQYILKLGFFNISIILYFFASIYILMIPSESFTIFGIYLPGVFLAIANIFFILYDYSLTLLIIRYITQRRYKHK